VRCIEKAARPERHGAQHESGFCHSSG